MTELEFLLEAVEDFFLPSKIVATKKLTPGVYSDIAITLANLLSNGVCITGKKLEDRLIGLIDARRRKAANNKVDDSDVIGYFQGLLDRWRSINQSVVQANSTEVEFLKSELAKISPLNVNDKDAYEIVSNEIKWLRDKKINFKIKSLEMHLQSLASAWKEHAESLSQPSQEDPRFISISIAIYWFEKIRLRWEALIKEQAHDKIWQEFLEKQKQSKPITPETKLETETVIEAWLNIPQKRYPVKQKVELCAWGKDNQLQVCSNTALAVVPCDNVLVNGQPITKEFLEEYFNNKVELDPEKIERPLG